MFYTGNRVNVFIMLEEYLNEASSTVDEGTHIGALRLDTDGGVTPLTYTEYVALLRDVGPNGTIAGVGPRIVYATKDDVEVVPEVEMNPGTPSGLPAQTGWMWYDASHTDNAITLPTGIDEEFMFVDEDIEPYGQETPISVPVSKRWTITVTRSKDDLLFEALHRFARFGIKNGLSFVGDDNPDSWSGYRVILQIHPEQSPGDSNDGNYKVGYHGFIKEYKEELDPNGTVKESITFHGGDWDVSKRRQIDPVTPSVTLSDSKICGFRGII